MKFWDCDREREQLMFGDIGEAVYYWADGAEQPLPETVTVYGWAQMELPAPKNHAEMVLDEILLSLDEEYGNPEEETEQTDAMKAAALAFVNAIYAEYPVWMCEHITSRVVKVADHVPPEWLTTQGAVEHSPPPSSLSLSEEDRR